MAQFFAMDMQATFSGFALGGSLIIAIGAQNAFILRMGLLRQHIFILCLICATSDALLIAIGISGLGAIVDKNPQWLNLIAIAGAIFLFSYAFLAARRALNPVAQNINDQPAITLGKAIAICLAFTFLNPHVYLDTVVLVGALAAAWEGILRLYFAIGAISASFLWFFSLGYGARFLEPLFRKKSAWRILDASIAIVMCLLAISLLLKIVG